MSKDIIWMGSSFEDIKEFPKGARKQAGHDLNRIKAGLPPNDWKTFSTVGPGTAEIRIKDEGNQYRVFYVAKFDDGIFVLHCFSKTTQKTSQHDIDVGKSRYKAMKKQISDKAKGKTR
ncbi:phage-related protein [Rhizobium sp. BK529]|uniref:type II toxin-antitoxin system RelE/ParE family toxin n=1 Tax=unclassified Rhizobium TaxID=2613769 RepID=UPI0010F10E38|nr:MULTISPECIES: type II toxin-antitoxin system RelE/ParE family toxin [unclassified Rhizobium]MBB3590656.1 phage-related protein [Rhizobium sp. BK529]TCS05348.1 phage-related protein [Rhizobium sp. BK418]